MTHHLITLSPIARVRTPIGGHPPVRTVGDPESFNDGLPEGYAYVPVHERPTDYDPETHTVEPHLTAESDGWLLRPLTLEEIVVRQSRSPSEVGSGQIRAAMIALDLAADGEALDTLVVSIINSVLQGKEQAIARTMWKHATVFKRAHPFIGLVQMALGKDNDFMDQLFFLADTF